MRTLFLTTVISVAFAQAPAEPTDVQGWIRNGLEAVKAGRHDDALKAMDGALQIDPNNLHALHTLAFLQFNRDMLTEAQQRTSASSASHPMEKRRTTVSPRYCRRTSRACGRKLARDRI